MAASERIVTISHRLYMRLLVTCQSEFRHRYEQEMGQVFRDQCRRARQQRGMIGVARWWIEALSDLAETSMATRVEALTQGEMDMKRVLRITAQGTPGCAGILLLFYTMIKRPMPPWNAGILLCLVIACLSASLGLTWAAAFREKRRTRES